jgi:hypothetical protein
MRLSKPHGLKIGRGGSKEHDGSCYNEMEWTLGEKNQLVPRIRPDTKEAQSVLRKMGGNSWESLPWKFFSEYEG